jgi:hypothetical protein
MLQSVVAEVGGFLADAVVDAVGKEGGEARGEARTGAPAIYSL